MREDVIPYIQRLPSLADLAFLYPSNGRLTDYVDEMKEYAMLNELVVKGFTFLERKFLHWFEAYDDTPVVEINNRL